MKINWKVRIKNPLWWVGLLGVICTAMGVSPDMFTNWSILWANILALLNNPFLIVSVVVAVIGYNTDPTTSGLSDSTQALTYQKPYKDGD